MHVKFNDLPILRENDKTYFLWLEAIINTVDELSTLEVRKNLNSYSFRIALSAPSYLKPMIEQLNQMHNKFNIKVDFSKSIKTSSTLFFKINLED